ncbi:hypothetical protein KSK37_04920 [Kaistella sp. DKR-2]|uniref:hypothetical protein n=1 Tax=Kaistella soli TaxID=2849654 RepID=UPI001C27DF21|nr:hypothetical protein [Kaistella soli]MBU8882424.1 hypothetical protein [Kaistella soli]
MKKIITLLSLAAFAVGFSQNFTPNQYPKGVYETYEDFRTKTPTSNPSLSAAMTEDQIAYRFNNLDDKGKKLKKAFAISDGENVYLHVVNLIKKFNSEDKGQGYDGGIYYLKAENKGGYLFVRDYFTSNSAAIWGGIIAAAAARRTKGVIYEEEKESFNLFRNMEEFKTFMQVNHPSVVLDLEKGKGDAKLDEGEIEAKNLALIKSA